MVAKLSVAWRLRMCVLCLAMLAQLAPVLAARPAPVTARAPGVASPLQPGERTHLVLQAKQSVTLDVRGPANTLAALELDLDGGLLAITSPGLRRSPLELGKGGRFTYVVDLGAGGDALVQLESIEQKRVAELDVTRLASGPGQEDLSMMRRAEEALILGESARKHLDGSPPPEAAEADYKQAALLARQIHDTALERFALTQHGRYLIYGRSDIAGARALLKQAAALPADPSDDPAGRASTLKSLSSAEMMLGNYSAATEAGERALALYRQTGDLYWQGIVLGNLASAYSESGDTARGAAALREGLADAEAMQDGAGVVFCLSQLAAIDRQRGDFESAFQSFRDALDWVDRIPYAPLIEAEIEKELGLFYAQLGMWSEADSELRQSLRHLNGIENTTSLEARETLARGLAEQGRYAEAARAYDEAAVMADRLKLRREQSLLLLGAASVLAREGRTAAQTDLNQASAIAEDLGSPALRVQVELTRATIAARPADALRSFADAAALAQASGEREEEAAALAGEAHALDQSGLTGGQANALPVMLRALQLVEQSRSTLDSRDLAASYFTEHHLWYEWATAIAMHSGQDAGEKEAFALAERGRARSMLDSLEQRAWGPSVELPAELASRSTRNREAIEQQRDLLGSRVADLSATAATLRRLYQEQDALEAEERSVSSRSQTKAGLDLLHSQVVSSEDVQRELLGPGTAMVAFSLGPERSYRWLITGHALRTELLPGRKQLERTLAPLLAALESRRPVIAPGEDIRSFAARAQHFTARRDQELARIGTLLLSGIPREIHTLYLVPDGPLLALPWNALRLACGERSCSAIERFEILSEPSASVAVALARSATPQRDASVLIVADPAPAPATPGLLWSSLPALEDARREAASIRRYSASVHVLEGRVATPSAVLDLTGNHSGDASSRSFGILHIAAHTVLAAQHPELSGIALAPPVESGAGHPGSTGILWLRDISSMHAPPLVVLSGCQTQGGSRLAGEALQSLSQAFFFGGAHGVVASLWSVNDASTAELMAHFYRNLLERRMPAPSALRAAELAMLRAGRDVSDWAPFVFTGVAGPRAEGFGEVALKASSK